MKQLFLLLFLSFGFIASSQVVLKKGMKITRSVKVKNGNYFLQGNRDLDKPVIEIAGNNITVDFAGATLQGNSSQQLPDTYSGLGILIKGKNIIIKNLKARGYKVALLVRETKGLVIENCDLSYNYRPRLKSTQEKEDIADWMSYHLNEKDEWLRYGAALYLSNCDSATIRNCRVTGGQNALMMTRCDNGNFYNNDFSFNSGIGIGLYRSSGNKFMYNKLNFNVRGYSHGVYNRGQDSAGFLVYEQSSGNLFYENSATHSGDGFFLWAGQTTINTGEGGCNDNLIMGNDFSFAPTNGIEVTFSRNRISKNRIFECDHGIWGGYSYQTRIDGNHFRNNRIAIAIEHGQYNSIDYNIFFRDKEAIRLWTRKEQPADWGYSRSRDTRSVGTLIAKNSFNDHPLVYNFSGTDSLHITGNTYSKVEQIIKADSTVGDIDTSLIDITDTAIIIPKVLSPRDPFKGGGRLAGRKNIMMTEWGPYNFRYPLIWNTNPVDSSGQMEFEVLGPKGSWRILSVKGLESLSLQKGGFPSRFTAAKKPADRIDIEIVAEFRGSGFTDVFGKPVSGKLPHRFVFRKFFQPIDFKVSWFELDSGTNFRTDTGFGKKIDWLRPIKEESATRLDYAWWGGIKDSTGRVFTQFITEAEGWADVPQGTYELGVTFDDAVRVYVDDQLVIAEDDPSRHKFDEAPHRAVQVKLGGKHHFRVEHLELGGFATLSLKLYKKY